MDSRKASLNLEKSECGSFYGDTIYTMIVNRLQAAGCVFAEDEARLLISAAMTPFWLAPGGYLLVETSERQAPHTVEIFTRNGLITQLASFEELDASVVIGTKVQ